MLTVSQLLILLIIANGLAAMHTQSEAVNATLGVIDEVKALEATAYNVLFDLCLYLRQNAPSFADGSCNLEAALAEWEGAVEVGVAGWQSIVRIDVELTNMTMGNYDGRALDAVQMMVAGDENSDRCFSGGLSITVTGHSVSSYAHFGICFLA
ncbi:MAG TPA: hypothetical protein P5168_01920 [Candidatus Methanomethylicus sp.]|nr:hypothetical protein [Candidatus Methanomethylicus sp.]